MARIRTIKPEFWTDDAITECSLSARLLFIGMWNFADDRGNIERSAKQMKMKIFPADCIDVEPLIQELIHHDLVIEYGVDEKKYLHIRTFAAHQVINRPSKSGLPEYCENLRTHGGLTEDSRTEGKGREGNSKGEDLSKQLHKESVSTYNENPGEEKPAAAAKHMSLSECQELSAKYLGRLMEGGTLPVLQDICHLYPPERIREAFQAAGGNRVTSINWVRKRLEDPNGAGNHRGSEKVGAKAKRTGFIEANGPDADWLGTGTGT